MKVMVQWLFIEEVARECRTHPSTVRQWIREGRLQAFRPGRRVLIRRADLDRFIASHPQHPSDEPMTA